MNNFKFIYLIILSLLLLFIFEYLIEYDKLYISSISEILTYAQIEKIIEFQSKWIWVKYVITPLLLLLKISIIAAIIDIGCFFFSKEIKYKILFNIVVKAEFIFLLVIIFKIVWFYIFQPDYTLEDLQYFYPLSALNIVGYQSLKAWFVYPFQVLNIFEVAYWFVLAYLIGKEINETTDKGLSIVASSYGVGLLIWVVGVMFLTLNMS
ncbi:hypothetical protein [uncultured Winogradskyella sp.]|uniref:hypothetical protein n=1 Tax=uncultured Winogradskyella sp. TaxID=395353 RepID=UPI0030EF3DBA